MRRAARATWTVAARELGAYLRSPVAWLVAAAFLALEGTTFVATVRMLADPSRPGDYGAVLRGQFAGSLLGWMVRFAVVSAVTMRLVAEERRQGTWETLVTAPVPEGAVTAGKWLAAWLFLCALWLPTAVYPPIIAWFAPPGTALDLGPIAAAYLGIAASLAAFAALGLLASAATTSQVVASIACFGGLVALLLVGELDEVAPAAVAGSPALAALVEWVDLRRHMDELGRGAVDLGPLVFLAALAAVLAVAGHAVAGLGRAGAGRPRRRALVLGLVAADALLLNAVVAHHGRRWDWSAADVNRLEDVTVELLAAVDRPLDMTVLRPALAAFDPVFDEVDRLVARMAAEAPALRRRDVDAAADPAAAESLADRFGAPPRDLADGGAVVLELGGRARVVELLDMASFARDELAAGAIASLAVERAVAGALAELVRGAPPRVCLSQGHGELTLADGLALPDEGPAPEPLVGDAIPARCQVVVVAGPTAPFAADQALAVAGHLRRGGGLLVIARGAEAGGRLAPTGLEPVLADVGIGLGDAVVVDPERAAGRADTFAVIEGYADHPATRGLQGRRLTVWRAPRVVAPARGRPGATVLVAAGEGAWAERDVAALVAGRPATRDPDDGEVVSVAAAAVDPASGARVAVLGSAASFSGALGEGVPANRELLRRVLAWVGRQDVAPAIAAKTPEHVRLIMTRHQLAAVFALCVVGLPLVCLLAAAAVARRRRRG